uniref:Uncharacterized protein n=1 Tax=Rhizophora mucronata TaxID=61149 RepID=A0A2P2K351_RHIMU
MLKSDYKEPRICQTRITKLCQ